MSGRRNRASLSGSSVLCCCFSHYMVSAGVLGRAVWWNSVPQLHRKHAAPSATSHCHGLMASLQPLSCRHQCPQILCVHAEDKVFHKLTWFEGHNLEDFIYLCLLCRDVYPFLNCNSLFLYSHRLHLSTLWFINPSCLPLSPQSLSLPILSLLWMLP